MSKKGNGSHALTKCFNILDFGAVGDGKTLNTTFIQVAIEAVRKNGCGTVIIPQGMYLTGTLLLTDNLVLHFDPGAVLLGSPHIGDYLEDGSVEPRGRGLRHYLIWGNNCSNVTLEGQGAIHGNGLAYCDEHLPKWQSAKPPRPSPIHFSGCKDLKISGITIVDSPYFTIFIETSERVLITGVTIRNDRRIPNSDGIDISSTRQVRISDCDIEAGDDCIALKTHPHRNGNKQPCEDVVVTNCVLATDACGVRVGYEGNTPIRDCVFSNLTIRDSAYGLNITSIYPQSAEGRITGTPIDRIAFSNIVMRNVINGIAVWAGTNFNAPEYSGHIRNISFCNICGSDISGNWIGYSSPTDTPCSHNPVISGILLRDVVFNIIDRPTSAVRNSCTCWAMPPPAPNGKLGDSLATPLFGGHWQGSGMGLKRIDGVRFENVEFNVDNPGCPALLWQGIRCFMIDGKLMSEQGSKFSEGC